MSFSNNYLVLTDPFLGEEIVYGRRKLCFFLLDWLDWIGMCALTYSGPQPSFNRVLSLENLES